jgi:tetratricopeptide (TPR) repeat protein
MAVWERNDKVIDSAYQVSSRGRIDEALSMLRKLAAEGDSQGARAEAMAYILYQAGRWEEAAEAFATSLHQKPAEMSRLYYLASALARAGKLDKALAAVDAAVHERPDDLAPLAARCLVLGEAGQWAPAREAFALARQVFARNSCQSQYAIGLLQDCADVIADAPQ